MKMIRTVNGTLRSATLFARESWASAGWRDSSTSVHIATRRTMRTIKPSGPKPATASRSR
eukprot:5688325-Prymnesium_polylepis.1